MNKKKNHFKIFRAYRILDTGAAYFIFDNEQGRIMKLYEKEEKKSN